MKYTMIAALVLSMALPVLACAQETETPESTLSGTWIRNEELSDNPATVMSRRGGSPGGMSGGAGRGGMGGGGGMRGSGGQRGGGGMRSSGKMPSIDDAPPGKKRPDMMRGSERLVIFHEGEEFSVTNARDVMQTVYTDGRRTERWTQLGQMFDTAQATKDGLVIESVMPDGNNRSITYILSDTGDRLTVIHAFKPPKSDKTVSLKMVYDQAE